MMLVKQAFYQLNCFSNPYPDFTTLFPWLLWQMKRVTLMRMRRPWNRHPAHKAWPGPVTEQPSQWKLKPTGKKPYGQAGVTCSLCFLFPAPCFTPAFGILGPHSKASMWAQVTLAKDICPQERWPSWKREILCMPSPGGSK